MYLLLKIHAAFQSLRCNETPLKLGLKEAKLLQI